MDNYYDIEEPVKVKGFTFKKLFKFLGWVLFLLVIGTIIVRCTLSRNDEIVSKVIVDSNTLSVYNASPEDFIVEQYPMNSPWVAIQDGRLVEFNYLYYLPQTKQLQFSVKYNLDIAENTNEYGIPFEFSLTDDYDNEFSDYFIEYKEKFGYGYIRVCFNNIELEDLTKDPDEFGKYPRNKYTLNILELGEDGDYSKLCTYRVYDGGTISKRIKIINLK